MNNIVTFVAWALSFVGGGVASFLGHLDYAVILLLYAILFSLELNRRANER